jgi:Leucine-rich repeat (LRR) protein
MQTPSNILLSFLHACALNIVVAIVVGKVLDVEVSLEERVEAWKKGGGEVEQAEIMRYKVIMFQRMPQGIAPNALTSLDLSHGGLRTIHVAQFPNLEVLLLKGNSIKSIDAISGWRDLTKVPYTRSLHPSIHLLTHPFSQLKVLDLRRNVLTELSEIVTLIGQLKSLQSIGLRGNKFTEVKNWRAKLISMIPAFHEEHTELRIIDNEPITVLEIVKVTKSPLFFSFFPFYSLFFFFVRDGKYRRMPHLTVLDFKWWN